MLRVGATAPSFTMPGSDGKDHGDASLRGRPYVLSFYPKDETPGCIVQVCALRDVWADLDGTGVAVFGVSRDDVEAHRAFVANRKLPYVLLTDASGQVHKAFDVGRTLLGGANRVSYLVDAQGTIRAAYEANLSPSSHAERMLEAARALAK